MDWKCEMALLGAVCLTAIGLFVAPTLLQFTEDTHHWIDDMAPSFAVVVAVVTLARPAALLLAVLYATRMIVLGVRGFLPLGADNRDHV